jgi:hypothetical protein
MKKVGSDRLSNNVSETRSLEKHISAWSKQGAEAADEFVRRNRDRVYGICMSILGRREVAEDAAQEALLKAWRPPLGPGG